MDRLPAGGIVIVDWRGGARLGEPNKLRPAVVVEDFTLFAEDHPTYVVVPLTTAREMAIPALSVAIDPTPENGCADTSYALAFNVTSVARTRVQQTSRRLTHAQVQAIRRRIAICIGLLN